MGAGTFLKLHPSTSMTSNDIKLDGYDLIKSNYFIDSKRDGVCLYYKIFFDRMFSAYHCVKYARIQVFSDPYFPVFSRIRTESSIRENTGQRKSVFWHILRKVWSSKGFITVMRSSLSQNNFCFEKILPPFEKLPVNISQSNTLLANTWKF